MKVYLPSWNGDFRLETDGKDGTWLIVHDPTPHEQKIIEAFLAQVEAKTWLSNPDRLRALGSNDARVLIAAPLSKVSKVLIKLARPQKQTLTAVSFSDGKLSVIEGADAAAVEKISDEVEKAAATETPEKPAKAASVKRPTPCCPVCEVGAIAPASEVLLSFLNDEEHESWARDRAIVVTGGLTGHRYVVAHRQSAIAAYNTKMCFDLDDGQILHFHDNSVPPEEEVLAAKLILEHREPWLRNEATFFGEGNKFKNPFGDQGDGVESSVFMDKIARWFRA